MTWWMGGKESDASFVLIRVNEISIDTGAIDGRLVFGGYGRFAQDAVEGIFKWNQFGLEWGGEE